LISLLVLNKLKMSERKKDLASFHWS